MVQQSKIKVLIADDHEVVRSGLKGMLVGAEIHVVAAVTSGQEAVKYALENHVDVVLLDVRMSDGDGLNALGRIKLDKPDEGCIRPSTDVFCFLAGGTRKRGVLS